MSTTMSATVVAIDVDKKSTEPSSHTHNDTECQLCHFFEQTNAPAEARLYVEKYFAQLCRLQVPTERLVLDDMYKLSIINQQLHDSVLVQILQKKKELYIKLTRQ